MQHGIGHPSAHRFSRLHSLTAREIVAALYRDGFTLSRQKGSHRQLRHEDGRRVTISFHHASDTLRTGTLRSIVEIQARWTSLDSRGLCLLTRLAPFSVRRSPHCAYASASACQERAEPTRGSPAARH